MWGGYEDPEEEEKAAAAAVVVACASRASRARSRPRLEEPSGWWVVKAVLVVVQRAAADGRPRASDAARARSRAADAIAILRSGVQVWEAPPQAGAEKGDDGACLSIGFVFFLVFLRPPPPPWEKKMARYFCVLDGLFQGENLLFSKTPRPLLDHVVHPRAHQHPRPTPNELVAEIHEPRTLPRSDLPYFVKAHALVVTHELVVLVRCVWCRPECFFVDGAATKMRKRDRRRKITSQT